MVDYHPRDLANITDVTAVPRLLAVVAARASGLLNFADLSRTTANHVETLFRPAGINIPGATVAAMDDQLGSARHSDSQGLPK